VFSFFIILWLRNHELWFLRTQEKYKQTKSAFVKITTISRVRKVNYSAVFRHVDIKRIIVCPKTVLLQLSHWLESAVSSWLLQLCGLYQHSTSLLFVCPAASNRPTFLFMSSLYLTLWRRKWSRELINDNWNFTLLPRGLLRHRVADFSTARNKINNLIDNPPNRSECASSHHITSHRENGSRPQGPLYSRNKTKIRLHERRVNRRNYMHTA